MGKVAGFGDYGKIQITQSHAIAKYIARKYNLDGTNDFESAKCDEYVGVAEDLRNEWRYYHFERDSAKREEAKKRFMEIIPPRYLNRYSKILEGNWGKYLVGSGLNWVDLFVVMYLERYEDTVDKDILKPYPLLKKYSFHTSN